MHRDWELVSSRVKTVMATGDPKGTKIIYLYILQINSIFSVAPGTTASTLVSFWFKYDLRRTRILLGPLLSTFDVIVLLCLFPLHSDSHL